MAYGCLLCMLNWIRLANRYRQSENNFHHFLHDPFAVFFHRFGVTIPICWPKIAGVEWHPHHCGQHGHSWHLWGRTLLVGGSMGPWPWLGMWWSDVNSMAHGHWKIWNMTFSDTTWDLVLDAWTSRCFWVTCRWLHAFEQCSKSPVVDLEFYKPRSWGLSQSIVGILVTSTRQPV